MATEGGGDFESDQGSQQSQQEGGMIRRGRQADIGKIPIGKLEEASKRGVLINYDGDASNLKGTPVAQVDKVVVAGDLPPVDRRNPFQKFRDLFRKNR